MPEARFAPDVLDPWEVGKRGALDPLRWYVSVRRRVEPYWYRARWSENPWPRSVGPLVALEAAERQRLATLERIAPSAITAEHAELLFQCARVAPAIGDIVELGSDRGKSTIALSWGAQRNSAPCAVHAVDPFVDTNAEHRQQRIELLRSNLRDFGAHNAEFHPLASGEYRRQRTAPARLVFVDAAHDYLNSRFDFLAWKPLIAPGGFLLAHDVDNPQWGPGTRQAFLEYVLSDRDFVLYYHIDNLAAAQRLR